MDKALIAGLIFPTLMIIGTIISIIILKYKKNITPEEKTFEEKVDEKMTNWHKEIDEATNEYKKILMNDRIEFNKKRANEK